MTERTPPEIYTLLLTDMQLLDVLGSVGTMRDLSKDTWPETSARLTALEDNIAAQTGASLGHIDEET